MAHPHSDLVNQSLVVDAQALSTLAGRTAIILNTNVSTTIQNAFLMKRIRYLLQMVGRTTDDDGPLVVGLAKGDATIAEIATAMIEHNTIGPSDTTETLTEDNAWVVYQNTVVPFLYRGGNSTGQIPPGWMDIEGRKGIPALEDQGFQLFVYNAGSGALSTGVSINGICQVQGVWLRG